MSANFSEICVRRFHTQKCIFCLADGVPAANPRRSYANTFPEQPYAKLRFVPRRPRKMHVGALSVCAHLPTPGTPTAPIHSAPEATKTPTIPMKSPSRLRAFTRRWSVVIDDMADNEKFSRHSSLWNQLYVRGWHNAVTVITSVQAHRALSRVIRVNSRQLFFQNEKL